MVRVDHKQERILTGIGVLSMSNIVSFLHETKKTTHNNTQSLVCVWLGNEDGMIVRASTIEPDY